MTTGLAYFESLQRLEGRKFSSLESAKLLFELLGNPQDAVPAVHVGGTNGKGSVCAILGSILFAAGNHVGQTSSPHLSSVTERCFIDGRPVDEGSFAQTIDEIVAVAQRNNLAPSYFVLGLAAAFSEFRKRQLDWMVAEVGLGGRLDATNLIASPRLSIITSISADHVELLGDTPKEIAWNKAGIIRPGVPVFIGEMVDEAEREIRRVAAERGAPVFGMGREITFRADADELSGPNGKRKAFLGGLQLKGEYQKRNALLAISAAYALNVSPEAVAKGVAAVRWPGRLEYFEAARIGQSSEPHSVVMDAAHNTAGIEELVEYLRRAGWTKICFIISILSRKSWREMLQRLKQLDATCELRWIFTDSGGSGAVSPEDLQKEIGTGEAIGDPEKALEYAAATSKRDTLLVVTGSVFLVGKIRPLVTDEPVRTIAPDAV